jgi:hypothetical protein
MIGFLAVYVTNIKLYHANIVLVMYLSVYYSRTKRILGYISQMLEILSNKTVNGRLT